MKELINKFEVSESEVKSLIEWLAHSKNRGLEPHDLSCLVKYLLKQIEVQKLRIDMIMQENYLKSQKQ